MTKKVALIITYILGPLGLLIVYLAAKDNMSDEGFKQHLNQLIIIWIACTVGSILIIPPFAGFVFWVWGLIKAIQDDDSPLPLIGNWRLIK